MSAEKKPYKTTEAAGFFVAGQRVPSAFDGDGNRIPKVGHPMMLTDAEAKYELLQGTIEGEDEELSGAPLSTPAGRRRKSA